MPSTQAPNIGINYGWALGESGWNNQMDENLIALDALVLVSVLSATTAAPPGTPADGDRYIVAATATGDWTGHEGEIAQWSTAAAGWNFYTPRDGWHCWAMDSMQKYVYNSPSWSLEGSIYGQYADDAAASTGGVPVGGMYINSSTGALSVRLA